MHVEIEDLRRVVLSRGAPRPPGRPRRPLARRVDHDRLRHLGLPRQARRQRPVRPRVHRRRQQPGRGHGRPGDPVAAGPARPARRGWRSAAIPAPFAGLFNATGAAGRDPRPERPLDRPGSARCCRPTSSRPIPVTNIGQYGYALDAETSPPLARGRAGAPRAPRRERRPARLGPGRASSPRSGATPRCSPGGGCRAWTAPPGTTRSA